MAELKGTYANEENHQKVKNNLKKIGIAALIAGVVFAVIGFILLAVGISKEFGTFGKAIEDQMMDASTPKGMFSGMGLIAFGAILLSLGTPCFIAGIVMMVIAHKREIGSFVASSTLPVANDAINYVADNTAPAIGKGLGNIAEGIAGGIAGGIAAGKARANAVNSIKCPNCGESVKKDTKFCPNCGNAMQTSKLEMSAKIVAQNLKMVLNFAQIVALRLNNEKEIKTSI